MKKYLPAIAAISISLASTIAIAKPNLQSIDAQRPTVTQNAQGRVNVHKIPKFKLLRSNPHRFTHKLQDQNYNEVEDDAIISPYRRSDLHKIVSPDGINDRVRWKLFLARQAAMILHKQKWG
jgi:hypothetical protein